MIENDHIEYNTMSDSHLQALLGGFIKHHRTERNIAQETLAANAGISRSTLSLMENGKPVMFPCIIRVLRVLDLLYVFDTFKVEDASNPIATKNLKQRKHASGKKKQQPSL